MFYGWVVLGVAFWAIALTGSLWHTFPLFLAALLDQFGESRTSTTLIFTIFTGTAGIASPFMGKVIDRYGARRVMPIGALLVVAGLVASSQARAVWHLYLSFGVMAAIGWCAAGSLPSFAVLQNWFIRKRGLVTGIALTGVGLSNFIIIPVIQHVISTWGWGAAYLLLASLILVIAPLAIIFQRQRPQDMGLLPDGESSEPAAVARSRARAAAAVVDEKWTSHTWTQRDAIQTARFWLLLFGGVLGFGGQQIVLVHYQSYMVGNAFDAQAAANLSALLLGVGSFAKLSSGYISDHLGRELTYTLAIVTGALGVVALMLMGIAAPPWLPYVYVGLYSVFYGALATMPAAMAQDVFQGRFFGSVYGMLMLGNNLASGISPLAAAWLVDLTGNYRVAFAVAVGAMIVSCVSVWLAAPRKVRMVPGRAQRLARLAATQPEPQL